MSVRLVVLDDSNRAPDYAIAGQLLRGATQGTVSRQQLKARWPQRRDASLAAARIAAESWYDSSDDRRDDPEWGHALRLDLEAFLTPLEAGEPLPIHLRLPVYDRAMRDHLTGITAVAIALVVLFVVVYLALKAV